MKVTLVSFATDNFKGSQERLAVSARTFGIEDIRSYGPGDLAGTPFLERNKAILEQPRGAGYWLWKPYVILKTLESLDDGDVVIYSDSGIELVASPQPLIDLCVARAEIMLFHNSGGLNRAWTKRDCFVGMDCDSEEYWNAQQVNAGFQLYRKCPRALAFVREYLSHCENRHIVTDEPNVFGHENLPEFLDHRHDQSVVSLLARKFDIEIFRDPCQWGNYAKMPDVRQPGEFLDHSIGQIYSAQPFLNSPYGTILNHHRERAPTAAVRPAQSLTRRRAMESAVALHRAGRMIEALNFYKRVLAQELFHPDARRLSSLIGTPHPPEVVNLVNPIGHADFLRAVRRILQPRNYVEIGVRFGETLVSGCGTELLLGIDPAFSLRYAINQTVKLFRTTSDDFFAKWNLVSELGGERVDMAFVDGMHLFEFALRDFMNLERAGQRHGLIFFHDMHPDVEEEAVRDGDPVIAASRPWRGDVFKVILILGKYRPDLRVVPINDVLGGVLAVGNLDPDNTVLWDRYADIEKEFMDLEFKSLRCDLYRMFHSMRGAAWLELLADALIARQPRYAQVDREQLLHALASHMPPTPAEDMPV